MLLVFAGDQILISLVLVALSWSLTMAASSYSASNVWTMSAMVGLRKTMSSAKSKLLQKGQLNLSVAVWSQQDLSLQTPVCSSQNLSPENPFSFLEWPYKEHCL